MAIMVVGGGVSGLTLAERLLAAGRDVVVIEKEPAIGGLCCSYHYGPFTFDVGPHRLFSSIGKIHDYFLSILDNAYSVIPRDSQVHLSGKYLNWPLSFSSAFRLPTHMMARCLKDVFMKNSVPAGQDGNLRDFVVARYGLTIYDTFWKDYTKKFLGLPCQEVDAAWGKISVDRSVVDGRRAPGSLTDLVKNAIFQKEDGMEFLYPHGGMGAMPERLGKKILQQNGKILVSKDIQRLETKGHAVTRLITADDEHDVDQLVWTGSLLTLCRLLGEPVPNVHYLSTLLFNVEVDAELPGSWQWIYFPESDCAFSRVSCPSRFGRDGAPPGKTGLCVEMTCLEHSAMWEKPESQKDRVLNDLAGMRLVRSTGQVEACHIERVRNTYPVYRKGFAKIIAEARQRLQRYENLHLLGRQASFHHDNIDEAVLNAIQLAAALTDRSSEETVLQEARMPVLQE